MIVPQLQEAEFLKLCKIPCEFSKFIKYDENKTRLIDLICKVVSTDYKKALKMLKCK